MNSPFLTPGEVAEIFRLSTTALSSQRKRGIEPGALAVKVGGRHLYPKKLVDAYLERLAGGARVSLGLDESFVADLLHTPPNARRVLTLREAAERLGLSPEILSAQWKRRTFPGALGWQISPDQELVFSARQIEIWTESRAKANEQDGETARTA